MPSTRIGSDGKVHTGIRVDPDVWDQVKREADARQVSVNLIVNRAIADYLARLVPVDEIMRERDS